jgi:hypothetical protein
MKNEVEKYRYLLYNSTMRTAGRENGKKVELASQ